MLGGGGGRRELDRDVATAQQRLGIVGGGDAEPADAGQLAEILARSRAAGPGDAAGKRTSLGRGDVGDQHAADPPGNADDPDPDLRHRRFLPAIMPRLRACRLRLPAQRRQSGARRDHFRVHAQFDDRAAPRGLSAISKAGANSSVRVTTAPNAP